MPTANRLNVHELPKAAAARWPEHVRTRVDASEGPVSFECDRECLRDVAKWLASDLSYSFATLVVEEQADAWSLRYVFYGDRDQGQAHLVLNQPLSNVSVPSISNDVHAADWHERECEDLFGLRFEGHPRLGDFVLHEDWPEGVNPMRRAFDALAPYPHREVDPAWRPATVVEAPGAFLMPIGPVYSG